MAQLLASLCPSDTVYIYKLDRLGCSLKHLLDIVTEFGFCGVGFVSLTDAITTASPQGRLVFNLFYHPTNSGGYEEVLTVTRPADRCR
ncbi:recombinase family protein [Hymenobacter crusticola]|uniref:Resolvase/invertase-type recombinase catalytic domain-containing protein n=1 Tax=Hymenobacter crusticola TaxID=1770526 RepID=A0A243WCJ3_9BACT|nr:recombinase family protein [Hymenobacter crusticola]OUJ72737.1 hypothetical protein BXP70_17720 [Hymenobacter crusticola]